MNIDKHFDCIIEIIEGERNYKYEIDEKLNMLRLSRVLPFSLSYPTNYGYIPETISEDGDPLDVMLYTPWGPMNHLSVVSCVPLGIIKLTDNESQDHKILAVPCPRTCRESESSMPTNLQEVDPRVLKQIKHFLQNYKPSGSIEFLGWGDAAEAWKYIAQCYQAFNSQK